MTGKTGIPPHWGYEDKKNVAVLRQMQLLATGWKPVHELRAVLGGEHIGIAQDTLTLLRNTYLIAFTKRGEIWYVKLTDLGVQFCLEHHI